MAPELIRYGLDAAQFLDVLTQTYANGPRCLTNVDGIAVEEELIEARVACLQRILQWHRRQRLKFLEQLLQNGRSEFEPKDKGFVLRVADRLDRDETRHLVNGVLVVLVCGFHAGKLPPADGRIYPAYLGRRSFTTAS